MSYPRATVEVIDGVPVLHDPDALEGIRAVGKANCRNTLDANADRVGYFARRAAELGRDDVVIVLIAVDDRLGNDLANALMPGHDWQQYRDRGELPYARGLAGREGVQAFLAIIDADAAAKLLTTTGLACVVVDYGVAEVYPVIGRPELVPNPAPPAGKGEATP